MSTVSIYDVAREAGVSYGTVSRALNGRSGVSPHTRRRVVEAVARLGYVPSPIARGLTRRSTIAFGIVVPGMADPFFMPIAQGIEQVARGMGHATMLYDTGRSAAAAVEAAAFLAQFRVAGVVVLGGSNRLDDEMAEKLAGIPTVVALRRSRGGVFPAVFFDHAVGSRLVVEHLRALGRRRIAFVGGDEESVAGVERLRGFREAMRDTGQSADLVLRGAFTLDGGAAATVEMLAQPAGRRPDAIFYASDAMALAGMRRLREAGVRVPDDVAVVGYGDIAFAAIAEPPLTTVRVHQEQIGLLAARLLEQMVGGGPRPADIEVGVELIVRGSSAAS
ncbi:MAG TPA: LacI family DNA-binding transcriptional regulator [Chloroflexota bacterium]|nr:LacI family DNA-binding transcriptional regulator [Chloroflexota bacterium]